MNEVELLLKQTSNAYDWTFTLLNSIPEDKWDIVPPVLETSVTWQAGHLIMSFYFHSVMVITGHLKEVFEKVPLKEYDTLFTRGNPALAVGKTTPAVLKQQLRFVADKSLETIQKLSPSDLDLPLEPTHVPHPIAKTKYEAIDWNIKHTMWHCGQIAIVKRVTGQRFDFGLKHP